MPQTQELKSLSSLDHLSKADAEKLDLHEKNIRTFIKGHRNGAANLFGYAFYAGRELLAAKAIVPHGNSDPNGGFKKWAAARFTVEFRTCENWMCMAEAIIAKSETVSLFKPHQTLLTNGDPTVKNRATITKLIPEIMDGKGMMRFLRDSRLLRAAEKPKHHPRKKVDAEKALAARAALAERHWTRVAADQDLGEKLLRLISRDLLKAVIDRNVATNNLARTLLNAK